jgi:hypothetical protein
VNEPRTVEDRLEAIEQDLIEIRAQQGMLRLSPGGLLLFWALVSAFVGAVVFVVRLEGRMDAYTRIVAEDHQKLGDHVRDNGHPLIDRQLLELSRDLERLEKRVP